MWVERGGGGGGGQNGRCGPAGLRAAALSNHTSRWPGLAAPGKGSHLAVRYGGTGAGRRHEGRSATDPTTGPSGRLGRSAGASGCAHRQRAGEIKNRKDISGTRAWCGRMRAEGGVSAGRRREQYRRTDIGLPLPVVTRGQKASEQGIGGKPSRRWGRKNGRQARGQGLTAPGVDVLHPMIDSPPDSLGSRAQCEGEGEAPRQQQAGRRRRRLLPESNTTQSHKPQILGLLPLGGGTTGSQARSTADAAGWPRVDVSENKRPSRRVGTGGV